MGTPGREHSSRSRSRSRRSRFASGVAVAALAGTALAACGSSGPFASSNGESAKSADQILVDAKHATNAAAPVKVSGTLNESGQRIGLDLVEGNGTGGGRLSEGGDAFQLVVKGSTLYLRAPEATWTGLGAGSVARRLAGKWLSTPTTSQNFSSIADLTDISKLTSKLTPNGKLTKEATTTFDGQSAIPLKDQNDSGGTLYVATHGKPYILGITGSGKSSSGKLVFTEYGTAKVPAVPGKSESLAKLAG